MAFNPAWIPAISSGLSNIAGGAYGLSNNPASAAMGYAEQLPETVSPYYQPFIDAGLGALPTLQQQYGMMATDPGATMQMLGGGFQESPGFQFQLDQALNAANMASGAGGMLGSPFHQQQAAELAQNIASQDYYNYLGNAANMYQTGLGGLGGIAGMGYGASDALGGMLGQNLMNQATLAGQQAQYQQQGVGQILGGIGGAISSIF